MLLSPSHIHFLPGQECQVTHPPARAAWEVRDAGEAREAGEAGEAGVLGHKMIGISFLLLQDFFATGTFSHFEIH